MTWLQTIQLLGPGLVALAGAWRAHSKTAKRLAVVEAEHAECTRNVEALRVELGLKNRDETAGGGALMRSPHSTEQK